MSMRALLPKAIAVGRFVAAYLAGLLVATAAVASCGDEFTDGAGDSAGTASGVATGGDGGSVTTGEGGEGAGTGGTGGAVGPGGQGGGPLGPCEPIAGQIYASLGTVGSPTTAPPIASHPDINMKVRGWEQTGGALTLVSYGGDTDPLAPKLDTIFGANHVPQFVQNYAVHDWDWPNMQALGPISNPEVTLIAFASSAGEILELPHCGYDIGAGFGARVLYVDDDSMTLKYTGEDNVVSGYTIHLVQICPEPSLKARYEADHAAGRSQLPALYQEQPLGRARGNSFLVAIRDTGAFMDPRSDKDWWP